MDYSDRLAYLCIANGADNAAVGAWPDFKRETYLYDKGIGLPPKVEGKPYWLELEHAGFDEFDDAGWEWKDPGKFVVGCYESLGELERAVYNFDPDEHMNTNDGLPPEFKLTIFAGQATNIDKATATSTYEVTEWCKAFEAFEGHCVVLEYQPTTPSPSQRGGYSCQE